MENRPTRRRFLLMLGQALAGGLLPRSLIAGSPEATTAREASGRLAGIEADVGGRLGVRVLDTQTGRHWGRRSDERFPMCSTFKVLAVGALLKGVDAGNEDLDRRVEIAAGDLVTYSPVTESRVGGRMTLGAICEAALTRSDNTAGNIILDNVGGPPGVTAFARSLGDRMTRLDRRETDLNEAAPGDPRDTTTPAAMAEDLRRLLLGDRLSRQARNQLTAWMVANRTGDAKLRAALPGHWRIADKTGGGNHGTTNDIAAIWPPGRAPVVVCVYLTESEASFKERNAAIAAVGTTVRATLR